MGSPYQTSSFQNTFGNPLQGSVGYFQGFARDNPATQYQLSAGKLNPGAALPMIAGGVAITTLLSTQPGNSLGATIQQATSVINGFSVFDQQASAICDPQSPVPLIYPGGSVNYYPLKSNAIFAVAIDSTFAATLLGGSTSQQLSWDFNQQKITAYEASGGTIAITSITPTFVPAVPGAQAYWNMVVVAASNSVVGGVGSEISISGATNTGAGGNALVNGSFIVSDFTNAENFSFTVQNTSSTAVQSSPLGGTIVMPYSGGLLDCNIIDINIGNSQIAYYQSGSGNAVWVPNSSCALIQI